MRAMTERERNLRSEMEAHGTDWWSAAALFAVNGRLQSWWRRVKNEPDFDPVQTGWSPHPEDEVPTKAHMDALEQAWGIIANASEGEWGRQTPEWVAAAEEWRDQVYHPALTAYLRGQGVAERDLAWGRR